MTSSPASPFSSPEAGSMLEVGYRQVEKAADHLDLGDAARNIFLAPARILDSWIPDPRKDGTVIRAMRVQHSFDRGPSKGGMRMAESVNPAEVNALALFMTLKTATVDLPLGGGKGGVFASAEDFDDDERAELFGRIAERWAPIIGPDFDVLGPDVGTGENEMGAVHTRWRQTNDRSNGTPSTGKPAETDGLAFRAGATARGLDAVLDALQDSLGLGDSFTFAVQGYGSVGRGIAERLIDRGHTLVAISDSGGTAKNEDGLDLEELDERKSSDGSVSDGSDNSEVFSVACDLFVPAALQGVIDADTAERLDASVVLEGANGPCTWDGIEALNDRGITVVPDILANSGGVSASFEEMTDPDERDDEETIAERFDDRLRSAAEQIRDRADTDGTTLRTAATVIAMERVLDA